MKVVLRISVLACALVMVTGVVKAGPATPQEAAEAEQKMGHMQESIQKTLNEEFSKCVGDSPLNSRRQECGRKSPPILAQARASVNNCRRYYARGTREQLQCQVSSYERAEQSLRESKPFVPFENPNGSDKSRKNTYQKI